MMTEEQLQESLRKLAEATTEPIRPGLAEEIKQQIPSLLMPHRAGLDTINIMVHLKISRLAAAAVIIVTMVLCANFFGRGSSGDGIYQDGKMLARYFLGGGQAVRSDGLASSVYSARQGKDVVYYGDIVNQADSNSVLMQWRLDDGRYRIVLCDLRVKTVSADELIKLQTEMLRNKVK
jgi:hypothetical protein